MSALAQHEFMWRALLETIQACVDQLSELEKRVAAMETRLGIAVPESEFAKPHYDA